MFFRSTKCVDNLDLYFDPADLTPKLETESEYVATGVYRQAFWHAFAQMGAFLGCFFGIRGPDNEWPYAWWAFALLGSPIASFFNILSHSPAKMVIRNNKTIELYNIYGKPLRAGELPLTCWEAIGLPRIEGSYVTFFLTDESWEAYKARSSCSFCICRTMTLNLQDIARFRDEFGLHVANKKKGQGNLVNPNEFGLDAPNDEKKEGNTVKSNAVLEEYA